MQPVNLALLFHAFSFAFLPVMGQGETIRNDWISPYYVMTYHHGQCAGAAQNAVAQVIRNATASASSKPFTVLTDNRFAAEFPPRSYVSWAAYYWPACCEDLEQYKEQKWAFSTPTGTQQREEIRLPVQLIQTKEDPSLADGTGSGKARASDGQPAALDAPNDNQHNPTLTARAETCVKRPQGWQSDPTLIYEHCPYIRSDGRRNPDLKLLPAPQAMANMSRAVLSNAIAYGLTRDETFSQRAVTFIRAFFLDPRSGVLPNANYAQIIRGPPGVGNNDYRVGYFAGLIEWRHIDKVVNSIVILRACSSRAWSTLDAAQMSKWASDYLHWLETSPLALQAKENKNNQATFYYQQVIALYILLGKTEEAANQANAYFTGPFLGQVDEKGDQPAESGRVLSLHYLSFGLEAMMAVAKMADNLGLNMWTAKTSAGSTIQEAVDFIIDRLTSLRQDDRHVDPVDTADIAPSVAAAMMAYGDRPDQRYEKFLSNNDFTQDPEGTRSWRLYNQPCSFYSSPSKGHSTSSQRFQ